MNQKYFYCLLLLCFLISLPNCTKRTGTDTVAVSGIVRDYTGRLDGCGFLIELDNGQRLEPLTLPPGIVLIDNKRIRVTYTLFSAVSICMSGQTAHILDLEYE